MKKLSLLMSFMKAMAISMMFIYNICEGYYMPFIWLAGIFSSIYTCNRDKIKTKTKRHDVYILLLRTCKEILKKKAKQWLLLSYNQYIHMGYNKIFFCFVRIRKIVKIHWHYSFTGYCTEYNEVGSVVQEHHNLKCTDDTPPCASSYLSTEAYLCN